MNAYVKLAATAGPSPESAQGSRLCRLGSRGRGSRIRPEILRQPTQPVRDATGKCGILVGANK
jgi:hypothetical protein